MKNNTTAYISLRSREQLDVTGIPLTCDINSISVVNNENVIVLDWGSSTGHTNVDKEGYYNFFWRLDDFCTGLFIDDNPDKSHDWNAIVNLPLNEINYALSFDNGQQMKMVLVGFWILTIDQYGNETPYHFNHKIIDRYNEREIVKNFSHDIVDEFAQLAHLDCTNCFSTDIEPTGAYSIVGTGFYADVRCKSCGKVTESGDGEFLSEVAGFDNGQFFPLGPLYKYSVRHTDFFSDVPGEEKVLGMIFAGSDHQAAKLAKKKYDIPNEAIQEYHTSGNSTYFNLDKGDMQSFWLVEREF